MRCVNRLENGLKFISVHYGLRHQLIKSKEELCELDEAIDDHLKQPSAKTREHIIEEIGDVFVMCWQVLSLMGVSERTLLRWVRFKVNRQLKRIEGEQ